MEAILEKETLANYNLTEYLALHSNSLPANLPRKLELVSTKAGYSKTVELVGQYFEILVDVKKIYQDAISLEVTDRNDTEKIALANSYLKLVNKGLKEMETHRKATKEEFKRPIDVIDGAALVIKQDLLEPLISSLKKAANFVKDLEEKERQERFTLRQSKIIELGFIPSNYNTEILFDVDSSAFDALIETLTAQKLLQQQEKEAAEKAAKEAAEMLRLENERLKAENEQLKAETKVSEPQPQILAQVSSSQNEDDIFERIKKLEAEAKDFHDSHLIDLCRSHIEKSFSSDDFRRINLEELLDRFVYLTS